MLVTNSSDETVSVLDTAQGTVSRTLDVKSLPGQLFSISPDALATIDNTHEVVPRVREPFTRDDTTVPTRPTGSTP